jgi:type 1 glutamine amidotransferase
VSNPLRIALSLVVLLGTMTVASAADEMKALIVDGQNNHNWKVTTPLLKKMLEDTGLFEVDVSTSPARGKDMSAFEPKFSDYKVVVSNYNGDEWSEKTKAAFVDFVKKGGGLVIVHAADNSFPKWAEYNEMIGIGGWGGRTEKDGPYVRVKESKVVFDTRKGAGGSHGAQHAFVVETFDTEHPITKGLPRKWLHAQDELYDRLRGPAKNIKLLATAYSDKKTGGTGELEPILFTMSYGKGRVFHTTLGHDDKGMKCVGFIVTTQRGTEWAATGKVTQTKVPADFPTEAKTSSRK